MAVKKDLVEKSGAWYSLNGERMGQGRDNAKQFLKDNPKIMDELRGKVLEAHGLGKAPAPAPQEAAKEELAEKAQGKRSAKKTKH